MHLKTNKRKPKSFGQVEIWIVNTYLLITLLYTLYAKRKGRRVTRVLYYCKGSYMCVETKGSQRQPSLTQSATPTQGRSLPCRWFQCPEKSSACPWNAELLGSCHCCLWKQTRTTPICRECKETTFSHQSATAICSECKETTFPY